MNRSSFILNCCSRLYSLSLFLPHYNVHIIFHLLMTDDSTDPDFNLQSFNDHGIFTVDELNELSFVIKPLLSAFHFI